MAVASPPLVVVLLPLLLILAALSPEPTLAAHSNPKPLLPLTPLRMKHERARSSWGGKLGVTPAADGTAAYPFTAHYFPQELDHFTFKPDASTIFYQKYLVNDTFWRRPGKGNSQTHVLSGWGRQACTEMIMPMSSSNESMFPPSTYSYGDMSDACFQLNGVRPRTHWITTEYVGYKIDEVLRRFGSNIIFSNGMRDPWSRGGVLKNISSSIVALVTEKGEQETVFFSPKVSQPKSSKWRLHGDLPPMAPHGILLLLVLQLVIPHGRPL